MTGTERFEITLLPGARELLAEHARELPQKDDLCGAFCAVLALRAGGIDRHDGAPLDQDAVAIAAGSVVAAGNADGHLPAGERGRRDYRLAIPQIDDADASGTSAVGLLRAIAAISGGHLDAIPLSGPFSPRALAALFDAAAGLASPVVLLANIATRHLWGSRPDLLQLLSYLLDGEQEGPDPDWDVGHFVCVVARVEGPAGTLYALADTYPSLGERGLHLQPQERLARALERRGMAPGGVIAVLEASQAPAFRAAAAAAGFAERAWDNGTPAPDPLR